MYAKYLESGSVCAVRRWLDENDVPTKRGGLWYLSTIRQMLGNRTYLGEYTCKGVTTIHPEARIVEDWIFEKVQEQLEENKDKSPMKWNGVKLCDYKDQISFDNNDPTLTEYLNHKAQMPSCPRCGLSTAVSKWGLQETPTWGRLQKYCCKKCNHQFTPHPDKKMRTDVDNCPECHLKQYVKRAGWGKRAGGERFQKYYCRSCERWFRGECREEW